MPSTNIRFVNTFLEALTRLVRHLFGRGRVEDVEEGKGAPMELKRVAEVPIVAQGGIPTFKPDLAGVPALSRSTMSHGASFTPHAPNPVPVVIPIIVITAPFDQKDSRMEREAGRSIAQTALLPVKRVHGRTPARKRAQAEKENIADHPNAPRRPQMHATRRSLYGVQTQVVPLPRASVAIPAPSVLTTEVDSKPVAATAVASAQPGSSAWERAKVAQLEEARVWSNTVKARHHRRSLPAVPASPWVPGPLARRASLSSCVPFSAASPSTRVRLPLKRATAGCTSPAPEPVLAPVARLWSDDKGLFSLGLEDKEKEERTTSNVVPRTRDTADTSLASLSSSDSLSSLSSSGSLTGVLDEFEDDLLHSPAWLGRRRFPEVEGLEDDDVTAGRAHRDSTWSEVFPLDAYA
ncbi:hypothetical protein DFH06DRAFT_1385028 [Mycena polygramma]|nr:hypothetical protein DFH06DRAFT_1385028 [Mycena polygramma]